MQMDELRNRPTCLKNHEQLGTSLGELCHIVIRRIVGATQNFL